MARLLAALLILFTFVSCNKTKSLLPNSGGKAFEVVLINDSTGAATRMLQQPLEGLPQQEPTFTVVHNKTQQLEGVIKYSRCILNIAQKGYWIEKNKYAAPQLIVNSDTANLEKAIDLINKFEMKNLESFLKHHHNAKAEELVKKTFNLEMMIPQDMTSSMKRKDFLWLSNNSATAMQNIIILRGNVDDMLRKNMKGETNDMYMTLAHNGLWEMKGDAMGGPYKAAKVKNTDITVIAFTYAPGKEKRNLIRQLTAALHTIKQYGK